MTKQETLKIKVDYTENKKLVAQRTALVFGKIGTYLFLTIMALFVIIPFYWMFNVSFQSTNEVLNSTNLSLYPKEFSPQNYMHAFNYASVAQGGISFPRYLTNTLVVAGFSTLFGTIFSIF